MYFDVNKTGHPMPIHPSDDPHRPGHLDSHHSPGGPVHPEKPEPPAGPGHPNHPEKPEKAIGIIVNGMDKLIPAGTTELTYEDVVNLAYPNCSNAENVVYTVVFSNGPIENKKGTLVKGDIVCIREGMIFNVGKSNKS